jgi:transposase
MAIALVLEGCSRSDAARQCGMDRQTLRDRVHRFNDEDVDGLFDRAHGGSAPRKLSVEQEAEFNTNWPTDLRTVSLNVMARLVRATYRGAVL